MRDSIEYKEGCISTIFNYVTWFVLSNIYFLVSNVLFIMYIINFGFDIIYNVSILFVISLIPMGPALTALYASMGKIIREKDINITRYYFKSYKINFKQSLKLWCIELAILFISYIDLKVAANGNVLSNFSIIFIIICIFTVALGTIAFPIVSRFDLDLIDVLKIAFLYSIKKIQVTVINTIIILVGLYLIYIIPGILFLCLSSIICFVIMINNKYILSEIEKEMLSNNDNDLM